MAEHAGENVTARSVRMVEDVNPNDWCLRCESVHFGACVHRPVITCDPRIQFGQPCVGRTRTPAEVIASMHWAGDGVDDLVDDYGIDRLDVLWACAWWVREGHLGPNRGTRSKRRNLWTRWSEHALWVLGGHDKQTERLCDPDDYDPSSDPFRNRVASRHTDG